MQKCPLCKTQYNAVAKVCPLQHCSNCGSLKLQTHKKRNFQSTKAKLNFGFFLPALGFFVLVYGYLFFQGELIPFLNIVAIYTIFFIGVLFKTTTKNIHCQECNAKNFPFVQNVNLNPVRKDTTIDEDVLTKKIAKTVLDGLAKEQKRHNKKDIIIRIGGAISLITIATLGTFFVKPDDVLLGEIIDMIKSLQ